MTTLNQYIKEQLKDPEFKKIWEAEEAEYQVRKMIISARSDAGMTQAELAKAAGMKQAAIGRIEAGGANPTITTLAKIARGVGKELHIEFA